MTQLEVAQMVDEAELLTHCAPVFCLPTTIPRAETIHANGTVGLIDTGQKKLLVTCAHVWTEFENFRAKNPSAQLAVIFADGFGHPEYITNERPLDYDQDLDLAVFEAHPESWNMATKQFYRIDRWPVPKVRQGDLIAFLGFAGVGRHTGPGFGAFNYSFFGLSVTASSDRKVVLDDQTSSRKLFDNEGNSIPPMEMGGMSGSPAYVRSRWGTISLAGFVQMGRTSDGMIFLTHAAFLNADGTLQR